MISATLIAASLLFFLVVALDIWKKAVPSILGTGILFVLAVVNLQNIPYGIVMFIFGWLLYEAGMFKGLADVKMIAAIGLLIPSHFGIYAFVIVLTVYTAIYNVLMRYGLKIKGEYAGTVPIFLSYLVVLFNGGFG